MKNNIFILRYSSFIDEGGDYHFGYKKLESEKTIKELITEFNNFIDQCITNKKRYLNYYGIEIDLHMEDYINVEYVKSSKPFDPFSDDPQDIEQQVLVTFSKYMSEDIPSILPGYFDVSFKILTLSEFLESI